MKAEGKGSHSKRTGRVKVATVSSVPNVETNELSARVWGLALCLQTALLVLGSVAYVSLKNDVDNVQNGIASHFPDDLDSGSLRTFSVVLNATASGDVSDYNGILTAAIRNDIAAAAGVNASTVGVHVDTVGENARQVVVLAEINALSRVRATSVNHLLQMTFGTITEASALLRASVLSYTVDERMRVTTSTLTS